MRDEYASWWTESLETLKNSMDRRVSPTFDRKIASAHFTLNFFSFEIYFSRMYLLLQQMLHTNRQYEALLRSVNTRRHCCYRLLTFHRFSLVIYLLLLFRRCEHVMHIHSSTRSLTHSFVHSFQLIGIRSCFIHWARDIDIFGLLLHVGRRRIIEIALLSCCLWAK